MNRGTTWEPIFDDYGSYSIGAVTLDPVNPDIVWIGTGENASQRSAGYGDGIYKSTDGGVSFRRMGLERSEHIGDILVDPRDSDVVYAASQGPLWAEGGDRGLYKTVDGGESWERVLYVSENTGIADIVFDPKNPDVIYAASYQRRRHVGLLVAGGPEGKIFRSDDAGISWKEIMTGLPRVDLGRIALEVSPHEPGVVYASVAAQDEESGFFRSSDFGESLDQTERLYRGGPPILRGTLRRPSPAGADLCRGRQHPLHGRRGPHLREAAGPRGPRGSSRDRLRSRGPQLHDDRE